ncbi:MAG: hypothetical protein ACOYLS_06220 [Polymorphobacter sp.]
MIQVQLAEGSRSQLVMRVTDPFADAPRIDLARGADLLFSAMRGKLPPAPMPMPVVATAAPAPAPERRPAALERFAPLADLRRIRNHLYGLRAAA